MRRFGLLTAAMAMLAPQRARAEETPMVCARKAVIERVAALLRQAGRPMRLLDTTVGELSAGTDRVVHCAVRGQVLGYDTNHHGMQPIDATFVVRYTLELRQNGVFLQID